MRKLDGVDEDAVVHGHRASRLRLGERRMRAAAFAPSFSVTNMLVKSMPPSARPIGGISTSATSEADDGPERRTDDDANRHVEHVAAHDELFELTSASACSFEGPPEGGQLSRARRRGPWRGRRDLV